MGETLSCNYKCSREKNLCHGVGSSQSREWSKVLGRNFQEIRASKREEQDGEGTQINNWRTK